MKNFFALLLMLLVTAAQADEDKGGFNPQGEPPAPEDQREGYRGVKDLQHQTMSSELAALPDQARVSLQGNILQKSGDTRYLLRDEKGSVVLNIAPNVWQGQEVKPDDLVTLSGRVVHKNGKTYVQVNRLRSL